MRSCVASYGASPLIHAECVERDIVIRVHRGVRPAPCHPRGALRGGSEDAVLRARGVPGLPGHGGPGRAHAVEGRRQRHGGEELAPAFDGPEAFPDAGRESRRGAA
jgi:hypothetical protein